MMTPEQFREALDVLGLKQTGEHGATAFFGITPRTVRRWASGEIEIPLAYAMLLRLMVAKKLKPENVKAKYGSN